LQRLSFGEFLLDPARRELWRGGERLSLPLKAFECIAYLAEPRTRAVGRDELVSAVWGRSDVSDNVVDQVMLRARRTLGDMGQERRMIRTVPRFGFAWVAPVVFERAPAEAPPLPGDASPPAQTTASLDQAFRGAVTQGGFVWVVVGDAAKIRPQLEKLKMPIEVIQPR